MRWMCSKIHLSERNAQSIQSRGEFQKDLEAAVTEVNEYTVNDTLLLNNNNNNNNFQTYLFDI